MYGNYTLVIFSSILFLEFFHKRGHFRSKEFITQPGNVWKLDTQFIMKSSVNQCLYNCASCWGGGGAAACESDRVAPYVT